VYGDDVIVPTAQAANAIELLEAFGLKVNRDKSCISGLYRESCGMDAYAGIEITPVRFRTVWSSSRRPDTYTSWIAYANQLYVRQYYNTYNLIVEKLLEIYKSIPDVSMQLACPSLIVVPEDHLPKRRRSNSNLQRLEWKVRTLGVRRIKHSMKGWDMLLRYFAEACSSDSLNAPNDSPRRCGVGSLTVREDRAPFSVESYTKRDDTRLIERWLAPVDIPERTAMLAMIKCHNV
jgi:hypothetical protein